MRAFWTHCTIARTRNILYDSKNQALYNTLDFCVLGKNDVGLSRYAYIFAEKQFPKNLFENTLQIEG